MTIILNSCKYQSAESEFYIFSVATQKRNDLEHDGVIEKLPSRDLGVRYGFRGGFFGIKCPNINR